MRLGLHVGHGLANTSGRDHPGAEAGQDHGSRGHDGAVERRFAWRGLARGSFALGGLLCSLLLDGFALGGSLLLGGLAFGLLSGALALGGLLCRLAFGTQRLLACAQRALGCGLRVQAELGARDLRGQRLRRLRRDDTRLGDQILGLHRLVLRGDRLRHVALDAGHGRTRGLHAEQLGVGLARDRRLAQGHVDGLGGEARPGLHLGLDRGALSDHGPGLGDRRLLLAGGLALLAAGALGLLAQALLFAATLFFFLFLAAALVGLALGVGHGGAGRRVHAHPRGVAAGSQRGGLVGLEFERARAGRSLGAGAACALHHVRELMADQPVAVGRAGLEAAAAKVHLAAGGERVRVAGGAIAIRNDADVAEVVTEGALHAGADLLGQGHGLPGLGDLDRLGAVGGVLLGAQLVAGLVRAGRRAAEDQIEHGLEPCLGRGRGLVHAALGARGIDALAQAIEPGQHLRARLGRDLRREAAGGLVRLEVRGQRDLARRLHLRLRAPALAFLAALVALAAHRARDLARARAARRGPRLLQQRGVDRAHLLGALLLGELDGRVVDALGLAIGDALLARQRVPVELALAAIS